MAKRRKLTAPSDADLSKIEEEFRRETPSLGGAMAPIATVAADAAQSVEVVGAETRARLAKAESAAEAFDEAQKQGLILQEIALDQIEADAMFRDRMVVTREELDELRSSILSSGLRMPIEVFQMEHAEGGAPFGLISGYRRLMVMREIYRDLQMEKFSTIKAVVREPKSSADRFAAVVEENEVRASLSHFERGRYAALTVANEVFSNVEEGVDKLFPFASKAKRSKVRSFALIFEEMGDLVQFGEAMTERQGLRIAAALRAGADRKLRDALGEGRFVESWRDEWALIEDVVEAYEEEARDPSRGGRPSKASRTKPPKSFETNADIRATWQSDGPGSYTIRLKGQGLTPELMDSVMAELKYALSRAD